MRVLESGELNPSTDLAEARAQVASCPQPESAATRAQVLAFIDAHDDALMRSCASGHLTGSAFVYDPAGDRFLLLLHTKLRKWLQPGGHADGDANLAAVARREAMEETGIVELKVVVPPIDLDVHLVEPPHEAPHDHYDVRFLVLATPDAAPVGNHESTDMAWVRVGDLDALGCDQSVHRMVAAGRAAAARLLDSAH